MSMPPTPEPDVLRPWSLKAIPSRMIEEVNTTAARLNLTNSQLIERAWTQFRDGGGTAREIDVGIELRGLLAAAGPFGQDNPMPGGVRRLLNHYARLQLGSTAVPPTAVPQGEPARISVNSAEQGGPVRMND